ncbi:MAG: hypothetical protein PPHEMADM_3500 [uncultured Paraburkholderia sp.]|nr:MAG: hypothetical protein PPHEMADM_3500 [uncultured Paraburkholderia sp.]
MSGSRAQAAEGLAEASPEFGASLVKMAPRKARKGRKLAAIREPQKTKARKNSVLRKLVRQLLC